ncbi:MAG: hypothetical protein KGL44_03805 [Sphingomonadales bacterium]|nr:hypothetical protein [Sphingomonadales bacterium]
MIPRFQIYGTCCAEEDGEWEGKTLQVRWLGLMFEFTIAWPDRLIDG